MRLCINVFVCSLFVVFVSCKSGNKPETTRQVKNEGNLEKNVFKNSNKLPKKDDSEYPILVHQK